MPAAGADMTDTRPQPTRDDRRRLTRWLIVVTVAGVLARVVALVLHPPLNPDEVRYLITAHHLRSGAGYADWHGPEIDILPLHPLLTAASGAEPGTLEWRGRLVSFAASILSLPALAALAWQVAGPSEAILAVGIASLHPWLLPGASRPQPESLYVLVTLVAFLALARVRAGVRSPGSWALAGTFLGCAYLARPEGLFVASVAGGLTTWHAARRRVAMPGALLFATALLVTILPYLVWLHGATGRWMITGKSNEIFFIGQAMHASGGEPPAAETYLALQREYGDWLAFGRVHPLAFVARLFRLGCRIFGWILPRLLGPPGIVGWCALLVFRSPCDVGRRVPLWITLPTLVLPLMMLTFPNEQVSATVVPFLVVPAAVGLVRAHCRLRRILPVGGFAVLCVVLLGTSRYPAAMRPASHGGLRAATMERRAAAEALALAQDPRDIATNSAVVAFHLRDPDLFGAPGTWRPVEPGLSCAGLAGEMRRRGVTFALIDRWLGKESPFDREQGCRLTVVERFADAATWRRMEIVRLVP